MNSEIKSSRKLTSHYLLLTMLFFLMLFTLSGIISFIYKEEIKANASSIAELIGPLGLAVAAFIADFFISFTPPDVMLFIVANSPLKFNSFACISLIALASVLAGNLAWFLAYQMHTLNLVPSFVKEFAKKQEALIARYGVLIIILGALTPLPYSATNWASGLLKIKWSYFFLGSLFRIPRIFLSYYILVKSEQLAQWFKFF